MKATKCCCPIRFTTRINRRSGWRADAVKPVASQIREGRFVITEEALERAWSPAAKAMILNTPWNPVGTVMRRDELETIAQFCERRNLFLISDEIYEAITYGGRGARFAARSRAGLARSMRAGQQSFENLFDDRMARRILRGPRAADPGDVLVLAQSSRGPATFIQDAAAEALTGPQDCVAAMREEYARRREQVIERVARHPRDRAGRRLLRHGGCSRIEDSFG